MRTYCDRADIVQLCKTQNLITSMSNLNTLVLDLTRPKISAGVIVIKLYLLLLLFTCTKLQCMAISPKTFLHKKQCTCLLVGCLTPSSLLVYLLSFTCCHNEIVVADHIFYLTLSQYTNTWPTSPIADPVSGSWQGGHWSAIFSVTARYLWLKQPPPPFHPPPQPLPGVSRNQQCMDLLSRWTP